MKKTPYPSEAAERFMVRLPDGMRDRIAAEAKANNRSMNSEIVARLEGSFRNEGHVVTTQFFELSQESRDRIAASIAATVVEKLAGKPKK